MYFISKPTSRELRERQAENLHKEGLNPNRYRGTASSAEEAHDTQRRLEREGETFDKVWSVSGDSAEAVQAHTDEMRKLGYSPEGEALKS